MGNSLLILLLFIKHLIYDRNYVFSIVNCFFFSFWREKKITEQPVLVILLLLPFQFGAFDYRLVGEQG